MKTLALAFGIVLTAILVLFFAFRAFGVADKVAGPLASSLLGLITWVHGVVDKALNGSESKFSKRIIPVNEFGISWPLMLVYAGLIVVAIVEAADIVGWVLLKLILQISVVSASRPIQNLALVSVLALPGVFWGIFLLGRWIGVMTGAKGYWILPVSVLTGRFLEALAISIRTPQLFLELLDSFRNVSGVGLGRNAHHCDWSRTSRSVARESNSDWGLFQLPVQAAAGCNEKRDSGHDL